MATKRQRLDQLQIQITTCTQCENMIGPPITGVANLANIILVGQAPGDRERET